MSLSTGNPFRAFFFIFINFVEVSEPEIPPLYLLIIGLGSATLLLSTGILQPRYANCVQIVIQISLSHADMDPASQTITDPDPVFKNGGSIIIFCQISPKKLYSIKFAFKIFNSNL
jgi:hypothetical protein